MTPHRRRSALPGTPAIDRWLIRLAAARLTVALADRLEEEWLAELDSAASQWPRIKFALGCCWASLVISAQHSEYRRSTASTETASFTTHGQLKLDDSKLPYFSLSPGTLFVIVGLHVVLLYGLVLPI